MYKEETESMQYFTKIYGNDKIKAHLATAILNGTLPHALLIDGAPGVGKRTMALRIAMALNCEKKHSDVFALPCEVCNNCRRIREANFVDVKYLTRQGQKATIGVEEVRIFRSDMHLSATESSYKIYIIEEAHLLTPQAQNALLIALEEPPPNVFIILLTEDLSKILTTIKSRTQYISLSRFEDGRLKEILIDNFDKARVLLNQSEEAVDELISASNGSLGNALNLLDTDAREQTHQRRELVYTLIEAMMPKVPYKTLYIAVNNLPSKRSELKEALEDTVNAVSDLVSIKKSHGARLKFYSSRQRALAHAEKLSQKRLLAAYDILLDSLDDTAKNANTQALLATLAAKLKLI